MRIRKILALMGILVLLMAALAACSAGGNLPKPPAAGALPVATMPVKLPSGVPSMSPGMAGAMGAPTAIQTPAGTADWASVKVQSEHIQKQAKQVQPAFQQIADAAAQIKQNETDPEVLALASQIADLSAQAEQDAAQIAITANDINYRIDHSEATTLRLSDDIGKMADRIGEMADRILWTEEQIGIMADRIVHSEHLINNGTQQTIDQIQETLKQITDWTRDIAAQAASIKQQTKTQTSTNQGQGAGPSGNASSPSTNGTGGNLAATPTPEESRGNQNGSGESASASSTSVGGATAATSPAPTATRQVNASPRRLEVLSRSIALNAEAMQKDLQSAKASALALNQESLADALTTAEAAASQIALAANDLAARASLADTLTPKLKQAGRTTNSQIAASLQALTNALSQAKSAAQALPADDAQAKSIRRIVEAAGITADYIRTWNAEIGQIVAQ